MSKSQNANLPAAAPLPPALRQALEPAWRKWQGDAIGFIDVANLEAVETAIKAKAVSLAKQGFAFEHIEAAILEAVAEMGGRALDKAAQKAKGSGFSFGTYICKVIDSKVAEIDKRARHRRADIEQMDAAVATSKAIQGKRVEAFAQSGQHRALTGDGRHLPARRSEGEVGIACKIR